MKSMDELKLLIALMVVDYVTQSTSPTIGFWRLAFFFDQGVWF